MTNIHLLKSETDSISYFDKVGLKTILDQISDKFEKAIPPDFIDLANLHREIITKKHLVCIEFGVGYSTIVMLHALHMLKKKSPSVHEIRRNNLFTLTSVDSSEFWLGEWEKLIPDFLSELWIKNFSKCEIMLIDNSVTSLYKNLPDIVPDFIYLDAPDPKDVEGNINGISFIQNDRTVNSSDPLIYESTLLPNATIFIDGRTQNSRYLQRSFKRSWSIDIYPDLDITVFRLEEPLLGSVNEKIEYYKNSILVEKLD